MQAATASGRTLEDWQQKYSSVSTDIEFFDIAAKVL
jgi:hypothetical protein